MDNSLIPRAFSPTDARRDREEKAREAERRSSARNTSTASIPAGGNLTLAGGIDVVDGGTVTVVGTDYDNVTGSNYAVTGTLATETYVGGSGYDQRYPGMFFSDTLRGVAASIKFAVGNLIMGASDATSGEGGSVSASSAQAKSRYVYSSAGGTSSKDYGVTANSGGIKLNTHENREGVYYDATVLLRDGKVTIAADQGIELAGPLTNNGAPISGGSGAVSSVAGKTGAVTLVKADVGLDQVDNTSDLNKPVSTAMQAALNGKASTGAFAAVAHAEFTATAALPASMPTVVPIGASFTLDTARSSNAGFATAPTASQINLAAGVYSILYFADCGASMGTGAVLSISTPDGSSRYVGADVVPGSWSAPLPHPNLYLPAAAAIRFDIAQKSGVARTCNIRVSIERIK